MPGAQAPGILAFLRPYRMTMGEPAAPPIFEHNLLVCYIL